MRQPGESIKDRYKIIDTIVESRLGFIYRAFDQKAEREVAIKILNSDAAHDLDSLKRSVKEGEVLGSIHHRAVVKFYSLEKEGMTPFLVTEYIAGKTMASLKEELRQDLPTLFHHFLELLEGINACHQRQVIHRNVKPTNLLIDVEGQLKIIDFGFSKTREKLTQPGTIIGAPKYMAPEQAQGGKITEACDIYSIAVVIWEFLTGSLPFAEEEAAGNLNARQLLELANRPIPMARFAKFPQFASLKDLIQRMLDRNPSFRPPIPQIINSLKGKIPEIISSSTAKSE